SLLADDFSGASGVFEDEDEDTDEGEAGNGAGAGSAAAERSAAPNGSAPRADRAADPTDRNGTTGADGPADGSAEGPDADGSAGGGRDAFFVGLGDAVMPTVMVASAAAFSPAVPLGVGGLPALNLPALGAMVGTLCGLVVLLIAVARGRAHAGLPLLNGGAVGGYLVGSLLAGVPLVRALGLAPYL
ncbi:MAG: presenilin family intramembrane aspartyl protease, partial [Haloferacaceae archaeon]